MSDDTTWCKTCDGFGRFIDRPCPFCGGSGRVAVGASDASREYGSLLMRLCALAVEYGAHGIDGMDIRVARDRARQA